MFSGEQKSEELKSECVPEGDVDTQQLVGHSGLHPTSLPLLSPLLLCTVCRGEWSFCNLCLMMSHASFAHLLLVRVS